MTNTSKFITTPSGTFLYKVSPDLNSVTIIDFKINPHNKTGIVDIPDKIDGLYVELIDKLAFHRDVFIKTVNLPQHLLTISDAAFSDCSCLEHVSFPKSLVRIGQSAFAGCTSLREVKLYEVGYISFDAFAECPSIESLDLGSKLKVIQSHLITQNDNFKVLKIPEGVHKIFFGAFANCHNVEEIHISKSVNAISGGAFSSLPSLKRIIVHPENPHFFVENGVLCQRHGNFPDIYSLVAVPAQKDDTNFNIPNKINRILPYAFDGSRIHNVNIPASVSTLGHNCFDNTVNMQKIKIPASIKDCRLIMHKSNNIHTIEFANGITKIVLGFDFRGSPVKIVKLPSTLNHIDIRDVNPDTKFVFPKETKVSKEMEYNKYNVRYGASEISKMLSEFEETNKDTEK